MASLDSADHYMRHRVGDVKNCSFEMRQYELQGQQYQLVADSPVYQIGGMPWAGVWELGNEDRGMQWSRMLQNGLLRSDSWRL